MKLRMNVTLDEDIIQMLRFVADREDTNLSQLVENCIKESSLKQRYDTSILYDHTDDGHCSCGEYLTAENSEIVHIIPISKGGTDDLSNKKMVCKRCALTRYAENLGFGIRVDEAGFAFNDSVLKLREEVDTLIKRIQYLEAVNSK